MNTLAVFKEEKRSPTYSARPMGGLVEETEKEVRK